MAMYAAPFVNRHPDCFVRLNPALVIDCDPKFLFATEVSQWFLSKHAPAGIESDRVHRLRDGRDVHRFAEGREAPVSQYAPERLADEEHNPDDIEPWANAKDDILREL